MTIRTATLQFSIWRCHGWSPIICIAGTCARSTCVSPQGDSSEHAPQFPFPRFFLHDVLRKKLAYPKLKRAVIELDARFAADVILVEDRASGTQLFQELIAAGCARATRVSPQGDKVMRMPRWREWAERGTSSRPIELRSRRREAGIRRVVTA